MLSSVMDTAGYTAVVLILVLAGGCAAQPQTNFAESLYIGFMRTTVTAGDSTFYNPNVLITTTSSSNVSFSITRADGTVEKSGFISASTPADLELQNSLITLKENQRNDGILVSSEEPISAVVYPYDFQGVTDAYLALPCQDVLIGRSNYEYFAVSFEGISTSEYHSQILLVGCRSNTSITITPTQSISIPSNPTASSSPPVRLSPGQSHSFVLNDQQTLLINSSTSDLTGTRIVSDKPLSVTSGNDCARVPPGSMGCEFLVEQIPPTATWGTEFILVPFSGRETGQYYKVVTSKSDTLLKVTCRNDSTTRDLNLASAGDFAFFHTDSSCSLESNNPILVVQVALSYQGDSKGDPTMILVAPTDEYVQSVNFQSLRVEGTFKHYINVMVSVVHYQADMILYDNAQSPCNWQPVIGSASTIVGWGCSFEITPGVVHNMRHEASDGVLFVMVYGFRENTAVYRAYGYPAGLALDYHLRTVSFTSSHYMANETSGSIMVRLQYQGVTNDLVTVHLRAADNTSRLGKDYNVTERDIEFVPGESFKTVEIFILNDNLSESVETFILILTSSPNSPNAVTVTPIQQAIVTIVDDDVVEFDIVSSQAANRRKDILLVDMAIVSGLLEPSLFLPMQLRIRAPSGSEAETVVQFSNHVTKFIVQFDLTQLVPMSTAEEMLKFNASLISRDTTGIKIGPIPSPIVITQIPVPSSTNMPNPNVTYACYRLDSPSSPVWLAVIIGSIIIIILIVVIIVVGASCYYWGRRRSEYLLMQGKHNGTSVTVTEILETHDNSPRNNYSTKNSLFDWENSNV